jgi:D-alanyl-D-alanine carboxypeptidase
VFTDTEIPIELNRFCRMLRHLPPEAAIGVRPLPRRALAVKEKAIVGGVAAAARLFQTEANVLRSSILLAAFLALAAGPVVAQTPAYIVVDSSGTVLFDKDAGKPWYPASISKLMTAYVTFRALQSGEIRPETPVLVTQRAVNEAPSKMGFPVGTRMTMDNALKMMIVKSANDIAVAVAETVGGSEAGFVQRMNAEARRLGMNSTHYDNPNGLPDDGQITTARDLALLSYTIWTEFPQYRGLFGISAIRSGDRVIRTHNSLLERYRGSNGMKTGFICASGFNVVASATRNGKTLIAVVLGSESAKSRTELAAKLLDRGFSGISIGSRKLAGFAAGPAIGAPVNMRDQVCGKRNKNEGEDDDADPVFASLGASTSSLEAKRFFVMDPVVVTTLYVPPQPDPPVKKKGKGKGKTAKKGKATGDKAAAAKPKPQADDPPEGDAVADAPAPKSKKKLILQ